MFRWIVLIVSLLAGLAGLSIGVLNPDPVPVVLPGWAFELPLGSLLMLTFAVGLICGLLVYLVLFHLPSRLGRKRSGPAAKGGMPERHG
jgi:uncharacterized integral membrane protein